MPDAPLAHTTGGEISGRYITRGPDRVEDQTAIEAFLGVPYAAAPTGDLRWRSPQPVEPWDGVKECRYPGTAAVQVLRKPGGPLPAQDYEIGEDCLNLNVYTPACDGATRPVLFWVHGGSYQNGRGAGQDGTHLCRNGDIVVVTVNYRMGLLGFIELAWLDETRAGSHNLGIQDQIAGLRWVHDNIAGFGGDPEQITICGESAGAGSVLAILASPSGDGLFQRVISQSAPASFGPPHETVARKLADHVNAESIDDLLALSADEILTAQDALLTGDRRATTTADPPALPNNASRGFRPAIDGVTVTRDAAPAAAQRGVPLLIGTNDDEGTMFALHLDRHMTLDGLRAMAAARVGEAADAVIDAYRTEYPHKTPHEIAVQWMGDLRFWTCSLDVADAAVDAGTPVHMYRFGWNARGFGGAFGAMHALEIPFVWKSMLGWETVFGSEPPPTLSDQLHQAWINYVRTGDPSHDGIGTWPRYDTDRRPTMRFAETTRVVEDPGAQTHRAWRDALAGP